MNNFLRLRSHFYSFLMVVLGIYLTILPAALPNVFNYINPVLDTIFSGVSQTLIIAGIVLFLNTKLYKRLGVIEEALDIGNDKKVYNAKLIPTDQNLDLLELVKRNQYVYKASIYIPSADIESLIFLRTFLSNVKIDSKIRIAINGIKPDNSNFKNWEEIINIYKEKIDLHTTDYRTIGDFQIIILDTKVWIQTNFDQEIRTSLLFSLSSYDHQGRAFVDLFNKIWDGSDSLTLANNDENK